MPKLFNRIKTVLYIARIIFFAPFAKTVSLRRKEKGFDDANRRQPSDDEVTSVLRAYQENIQHMVGEKGSFFVTDTQGLHKGQHLLQGECILVQFLYPKEMFSTNPSAINK